MTEWAVTTANAPLEFDTQYAAYNHCRQIDSNHFLNFWAVADNDGFAQIFAVDTSTWAVTTANASLEFDTRQARWPSSTYIVDSAHLVVFFNGYTGAAYAQVLAVNTTTWAVTTAGAAFNFNAEATFNSCAQIDSNHFINFWAGGSDDGFVQTFAVNTSTWEVTTTSAALEFDVANGTYSSCYKVDTNHFINFWCGSGFDGFAQIFVVNTSTWAVTTAGASLEFDTQYGQFNSCAQIDSTHFINFWTGSTGTGFAQVFAVNTSTWAVTTASTSLNFDTANGQHHSCAQIDSNHFINFFYSTDSDGFVQTFAVNTSTWEVTTVSDKLEFDTQASSFNSCAQIDSNHFINFWTGLDNDGYAQVFTVELPVVAGGAFNVAWARRVNRALGAGVANVS